MAYGFFLGCIMPMRYPGIESATRHLFKELGIEYVDVDAFSCYPAQGVTRSFDQNTWLTLASRNLAVAEQQNLDVIVICNGCYGSLFDAAHILKENEGKREEINKSLGEIGMEYKASIKVRHFADVLYHDIGIETIKSKVKKEMDHIHAAIHYGCHFLKPSKLKNLDDPERPTILEDLIEAVGAVTIDYRDKNMCCGAGGGARARVPEMAMDITKEKLENIKKTEANCILNVCPFCHLQYDRGQKDLGEGFNLPVLHLSQLYGMALGIEKEKLGLDTHFIPVTL
jgi:heterodisulfide reductase subunit B